MKSYVCDHCEQQFNRKFNVRRHIINNHLNNRKHKIRISCPHCQSNFASFKSLDIHQNQKHSKQIEVREYAFKSEQEFQDWKETEQVSVQAQFFVHQSYLTKCGERVKQYLCSRSGTYKSSRSPLERKRPQSAKGSRKIGSICPARIIATFSKNTIKIKYYPDHRPHEKNLLHLSLPKSEEKLLADKLKNGISLTEILEDIRNECVTSSDLQIKHFVKKETLHNIRRKYKIPSTSAPKNKHETNVSDLLKECQQNNPNPFIIFKQCGEPHDLLNTDDIFVVIMTQAQKEVLRKCCHEQICIDSVTKAEKRHQLVILNVIDELGEVFPCAFCLTSQINDFTMSLFFNLIKTEVEAKIETKLFISDDNPCFYNAWGTVMSSVSSLFLNKWYVDHDFRQNLRTIASKKDKCEVYSSIRALHEEPDAKRFSSMLNSFVQSLRINEYHEFSHFFLTNYFVRPEKWAICYRDSAFLNASIMFDKFHKSVTTLYSQFAKTQRLDNLLYQLLKTIRDRTFDRRIGLEEGHSNRYIERITKRHRLAKHIKTIEKIDNNEWQVESVDAKGLNYQVKRERVSDSERCECKLKCPSCHTCVHEFYCTCYDYLLSNYLCKHIHAVKMYQDSNQDDDLYFKIITLEGLYETINIPKNSQSFDNINIDINSATVSFEDICDTVTDDLQTWPDIYQPQDTRFIRVYNDEDNNSDSLCDNMPVILDNTVEPYSVDDQRINDTKVLLNKMQTICSILQTGVLNEMSTSDRIEINKCADEVLNLLRKDALTQG